MDAHVHLIAKSLEGTHQTVCGYHGVGAVFGDGRAKDGSFLYSVCIYEHLKDYIHSQLSNHTLF